MFSWGPENNHPLKCHSYCIVPSFTSRLFFYSEPEENGELVSFVLWFLFFFSITVQLLFIYIPKSYIFWWCVLSFLLHLIYSLVNICQLYLPSGERDLWMQSEGHRAKPALTTVLPTEGSFLYWQSPIITFQLSATGIKSQIILRWQGRLKGGINLCTSQAETTLTIVPIPPIGLDSCFSQYIVKGTVSVKSLYFFSIFLFWFLALSTWLHVFN